MKVVAHRFYLILSCLSFLMGTVGDSYHFCNMPSPVRHEISALDCHKGKQTAETNQGRDCCKDLSCPKCVVMPLSITQARLLQKSDMVGAVTLPVNTMLDSLLINAFERPPKVA